MSVAAIVVAGGSGSRFGGTGNKAYADLAGRPLVSHALATLARGGCEPVVMVIRPDDEPEALRAARAAGVDVRLTAGGPTRHASEHRGLDEIRSEVEAGDIDVILIHDAARPLVTPELVKTIAESARRHGGAVPCLPLDPPVFREGEGGMTLVEVSDLRRMQTPQAFLARPLIEAYDRAGAAGFEGVDTAEAVERFSDLTIAVVPGDPSNLKVTLPHDLVTAESHLRRRDQENDRR